MRQFVVVGHDAPTSAEFSLSALASEAGRLDLLARCTTAALLTSHGIRDDVRVHLVLADAFTVTVDGSTVRNLNPDERSAAALVRAALERCEDAVGHVAVETSPGVSLTRMGFEATIEAVASEGTLVVLDEDGTAAATSDPPADPIFVLSDHRDFESEERDLLAARGAERISLGPVAMHADHAVAVAHNWLDTEATTAGSSEG